MQIRINFLCGACVILLNKACIFKLKPFALVNPSDHFCSDGVCLNEGITFLWVNSINKLVQCKVTEPPNSKNLSILLFTLKSQSTILSPQSTGLQQKDGFASKRSALWPSTSVTNLSYTIKIIL